MGRMRHSLSTDASITPRSLKPPLRITTKPTALSSKPQLSKFCTTYNSGPCQHRPPLPKTKLQAEKVPLSVLALSCTPFCKRPHSPKSRQCTLQKLDWVSLFTPPLSALVLLPWASIHPIHSTHPNSSPKQFTQSDDPRCA